MDAARDELAKPIRDVRAFFWRIFWRILVHRHVRLNSVVDAARDDFAKSVRDVRAFSFFPQGHPHAPNSMTTFHVSPCAEIHTLFFSP